MDFAVPADHTIKLKESEIRDEYLNLARELNKLKKKESDGDTNFNRCTWNSHQRIGTETGGLENKRTSGKHPYYRIVEIGQNTTKSTEDLRRLTVIYRHI